MAGDFKPTFASYQGMSFLPGGCLSTDLPRLFGTPMWLAALYGKGMQHSDKYWVPPMWYAAFDMAHGS